MKLKRSLIIILALAMLMCGFPSMTALADSSGLCFLSFDDTLNGFTQFPVFAGGGVYLPLGLCNTIGLSYEFFQSDNTALLTTGGRGLFFDLDVGDCYDFDGVHYPSGAIYAGGGICFPAHMTCNYFGYNFSYIQGIGYGDIVRFKTGAQYLSDEEFLNAATSLMKTRYDEYIEANPPIEPDVPKEDEDKEEKPAAEQEIYLSFMSMPDDEILDYLKKASLPVCFFFTSDEIKENPDKVREILGNGYSVGLECGGDAENDLDTLYNAAQILPEAIIASGDNISNAENAVDGMGIPVISENIVYVDSEKDLSRAVYNLEKHKFPVLAVKTETYSKNFTVNIAASLKTLNKIVLPLRSLDLITK